MATNRFIEYFESHHMPHYGIISLIKIDMTTFYLPEDDLTLKGKFSFGKDNMFVSIL